MKDISGLEILETLQNMWTGNKRWEDLEGGEIYEPFIWVIGGSGGAWNVAMNEWGGGKEDKRKRSLQSSVH